MAPRLPSVEKGRQFAQALWNDTSGIILPYVTMMLVVIAPKLFGHSARARQGAGD
jgi:hypothetical protein